MTRIDRIRLAWCGLHPDRAGALVAEHGSAGRVVRLLAAGRIEASGHVRSAAATDPGAIAGRLDAVGARAVVCGDPDYPEHLAQLPGAPDVLFVRGRIPCAPAVAVVGTRRSTAYGRGLARSYGRAVAEAGWTLVSGLARGIDGEAHRGTVTGGGTGVAVLGSGIDVWYPHEHRRLGEDLLALGGGIVSEYPPGTPPEAWRFPPRNRIISGLATAVVIVEAAVSGGALITAARALDQGRTVLAVPGDVDRQTSRGTNLLIRDGAVPVLDPEDLVEALSLVLGPPVAVLPGRATDEMTALIGPVGAGLEELVAASGLPPARVAAALGRLEAAGAVVHEEGRWRLV